MAFLSELCQSHKYTLQWCNSCQRWEFVETWNTCCCFLGKWAGGFSLFVAKFVLTQGGMDGKMTKMLKRVYCNLVFFFNRSKHKNWCRQGICGPKLLLTGWSQPACWRHETSFTEDRRPRVPHNSCWLQVTEVELGCWHFHQQLQLSFPVALGTAMHCSSRILYPTNLIGTNKQRR